MDRKYLRHTTNSNSSKTPWYYQLTNPYIIGFVAVCEVEPGSGNVAVGWGWGECCDSDGAKRGPCNDIQQHFRLQHQQLLLPT